MALESQNIPGPGVERLSMACLHVVLFFYLLMSMATLPTENTDVYPMDAVRPRRHEAAILAASNHDILLAHRGRPGSALMGAWNARYTRAVQQT